MTQICGFKPCDLDIIKTLLDHRKATDDFPSGEIEYISFLGSGGFGTVYKVNIRGKEYALKIQKSNDEYHIERFRREIEVLKDFNKYENIIDTYGSIQYEFGNPKTYYCMYLMPVLRNVNEYFSIPRGVSAYKKMLIDLCHALQDIHMTGLHRDIQPLNVYYDDKNARFVLGDFTTYSANPKNTFIKNSTCPMKKEKYTPAYDIFELGRTIQLLNPPSEFMIKYGGIINKMTEEDPKNRYQNVDNILEDLGENIFSKPITTVSPTINRNDEVINLLLSRDPNNIEKAQKLAYEGRSELDKRQYCIALLIRHINGLSNTSTEQVIDTINRLLISDIPSNWFLIAFSNLALRKNTMSSNEKMYYYQLLKNAADGDSTMAQYFYGKLRMHTHSHLRKDFEIALGYLTKAKNNGVSISINQIKKILKQLNDENNESVKAFRELMDLEFNPEVDPMTEYDFMVRFS